MEDQEGKLIDLDIVRQEKNDEKRRQTERIFFKNLLGIYGVVDQNKLTPMEFVDVSEVGCSFLLPHSAEKFWALGSKIDLRVYFHSDQYLPLEVNVVNQRDCISDGRRMVRFGCSIEKDWYGYSAYLALVRFMKEFTENARHDRGQWTTFYL